MSREYLGDEVHMLTSDIAILRNENELLKMVSERKAEENRILREELMSLRVAYEERVTEVAAIRTCLESVGLNITSTLQRYMERRALKKETLATNTEPPPKEREFRHHAAVTFKEPELTAPRSRPLADEVTRTLPPAARVPVARTDEPVPPAPAFLRAGGMRNDIVDSRLPKADIVSDDDEMRNMHESLDSRRKA